MMRNGELLCDERYIVQRIEDNCRRRTGLTNIIDSLRSQRCLQSGESAPKGVLYGGDKICSEMVELSCRVCCHLGVVAYLKAIKFTVGTREL
jgi:hypothetical protein